MLAAVVLIGGLLLPLILLGANSAEERAKRAALGSGIVGAGPLNAGEVPAPYRDFVAKAGTRCKGVPAAAIAAQIEAESAWQPKAGSPVGAQGLTQFMPGTWVSYGRDVNGNGINSPFDPADAIDAQARYMCDLAQQVAPLAKSSGRTIIELAWAAYNAGPGAVEQYGGIPPYAETQAYVAKLRDLMTKYSKGGAIKASGEWVAPVDDRYLIGTSGFGGRESPCAGCSTNHQGQDLGAPSGASIYAACSGVVDFAGTMGGFGNVVFINCGDGIRTGYGHQSHIGVEQGQEVKAGQEIGKVGATGGVSGPHLHYEVRTDAQPGGGPLSGTPIDPAPFMAKKGITWN
ncbi:peptidoglycan DD-metalloendopeptidase family protein [Janibacter corallicola]|uniref:peptidoglycan DD-metalloendopeptidase family protein n=1 Tax=Janibacter corallicola TaxID=415212 RepID=UPI0008316309|nr:peptidoglycan DD-metalloendopeptidase family protein [Janibacter corallicola]